MASNITHAKCILVVGATAGIGRGRALALLGLPSSPTVIVGGRRQERLDELKQNASGKKLETVRVNIDASAAEVKSFADGVISKFPDVDAVVVCAGIQREFDFRKPESIDLTKLQSELNTNYTAPVALITAFLPHFLKLSAAGRPSFIIPVTSGLAFQPAPAILNYCATKAALHSFSTSLHVQLAETKVQVMEIIPPLVESELHDHEGTTQTLSRHWMPLDEFTKHEIDGLSRGDLHIHAGNAGTWYGEYNEKVKIERAQGMYGMWKQMRSQ